MPSQTVAVVFTRSTSTSYIDSSGSTPPSSLVIALRWKPVAIFCSSARRARQHVAGDLLDRELVERQVAVERVDHPVAILPDAAPVVFLVSVRVGVAREIQPRPRPPFAVVRRGQQPIDDPVVRVRLWCRRETRRARRATAEARSDRATRAGAASPSTLPATATAFRARAAPARNDRWGCVARPCARRPAAPAASA